MKTPKWNYGPSLEKSFWSVVDQNGKVIGLRIPTQDIARQICEEHNDFHKALDLLDAAGVWTGADGLVSDRVRQLILEGKSK